MAKVNQLKNQARREEQRENWSRAIELYTQALDASRKESQGFADLSLYNRIGDIYLRIGQKNTAVRYYEQAIELYAEQDLHTSAIALCNKVLRILPDRSTVFLQLGRLNLATNLLAEGREHYHRYATAMRKRGSEEAALVGLEELIAATGDAGTLTLWAGWLAEATDVEAAVARIERLRADLERYGVDPDEVAAQVRSKTVVGFEGRREHAPAADPLAGAFLTLGDDESAESATVEETPEPALASTPDIGDESEDGPVGIERGADSVDPPGLARRETDVAERLDEDPAADAAGESPSPAEPADAETDSSAPDSVEPGSIPWEQEVEEIIAEFDVAFEEPWAEVSPEPEDLAIDPGGRARSRPDRDASEATPAMWTHEAPRPPQVVEAAEFDELEAVAFGGRIEVEDDEQAPSPDAVDAREDDGVERDTVEALDADEDPSRPEGAEGEGPESLDASVPAVDAADAADAAGEEPTEEPSGLEEDELESTLHTGTDELEAIVHTAASLGDSAGFDAEPVVLADELPQPEPEEPSETDVASAAHAEAEFGAPPEPSDLEAAPSSDDAAFESIDGLAESLSTVDPVGPPETGSPTIEGDEDPAADDAAWMDEIRHSLDEQALVAADERAESPEPLEEADEEADRHDAGRTSYEASEPVETPAWSEADLEAETTAMEWPPSDGGPETVPEPEAGADPAVADAGVEREAEEVPEDDAVTEPDPASELEPVAENPAEPEPIGAGASTPSSGDPATGSPGNGRPGKPPRAGTPSDEEGARAPLAEPRLTVEEDPEDAFRDWVESASTGVLKRALSELENRKEHERAVAVLERLTKLEDTEVEFRIRHVEYLSALGRTDEAVDASLRMGEMLEVEGRVSEARDAYERTRRLAPDEERALEGLKRLEGVEEDSQVESVEGTGPKRPYMPDHVNGTDRGSVIDRPMPSVSLPVDDRGAGPRPYSGVAGGSEAGTDFEQLLSEFRAELHEKPAHSDSSSRTELGARLKEMGRLDDAIRELQGAVREPSAPPLAFELLGEAFLEKGQPRIAVRFLEKALGGLSQGDRDILGVLYQLGIAYEALSDASKALICYERIFSVDIDYRDIQERILSCST